MQDRRRKSEVEKRKQNSSKRKREGIAGGKTEGRGGKNGRGRRRRELVGEKRTLLCSCWATMSSLPSPPLSLTFSSVLKAYKVLMK